METNNETTYLTVVQDDNGISMNNETNNAGVGAVLGGILIGAIVATLLQKRFSNTKASDTRSYKRMPDSSTDLKSGDLDKIRELQDKNSQQREILRTTEEKLRKAEYRLEDVQDNYKDLQKKVVKLQEENQNNEIKYNDLLNSFNDRGERLKKLEEDLRSRD